ncbi:hypothetical protein F751_0912 [Auxenochlorella protothecoides]|uniref:DUF2421 domain-containing protein n=1 Tax=Auxenochlorella protothecoides TaxID=3075 RepID=A0A087SD94_AUXPR|nr:hypothetical protein F751_0912 [Auxenochlorella protothecoides]KFM23698.1 hypothetical protein F751_0912 [Auxenochlorella protothecoides]
MGPALRLPAVFQKPFVRVGIQLGTGTLLIMATVSPAKVWNALSLDPVVATPALSLLLYYVGGLIAMGAGLSVLSVCTDILLSSTLGIGAGMGIAYAALAINGGSTDNTTTRAAVVLCLSGAYVMAATILRFRFKTYSLFWLINLVTTGLSVAANYHTLAPYWKFPVHWLYYTLICCSTNLLVAMLVLPQTAGNVIRGSLAGGLVSLGQTFIVAIDQMTDEIDPDSGLLKARSGDTLTRLGIDEGLWHSCICKLYAAASVTGAAVTNVWKWEAAAKLEWDVYRRQHVFPSRHFDLATLLLRSTLSSFMMVVYPLQTGRMDCRLTRQVYFWGKGRRGPKFGRQHAGPLRTLAAAMAACCTALAEVLRGRSPLAGATPALLQMESAYVALVDAAAEAMEGGEGDLSGRAVSFSMLMATLYTVCTRLRRLYLCMAGALGKDDPGAGAALHAHFRREGSVHWHFPAFMERVRRGRGARDATPLAVLRDSLLGGGGEESATPRSTPSSMRAYLAAQRPALKVLPLVERRPSAWRQGLDALRRRTGVDTNHLALGLQVGTRAAQRRALKVLPLVERRPSAWRQGLDALRRRTGVDTNHLALGLQGTVAFTVIMVMTVVPHVNAKFDNRLLWALFIVITILEPMTGGVWLKGSQRFLGTVLGVALGLAALYFTYLCNGLTYASHPQKYIVMSLSLAVISGIVAGCALRFPRFFYGFLITDIILAVVALPGYHTPTPMPEVALWRLVTTVLGVAVNMLCATALFPVTGRSTYSALMVATLEGLGGVLDHACHSLLPHGDAVLQPVDRMLSHPGSRYMELSPAGESFKMLGGDYMDSVPLGKTVGQNIGAMAALDQALHYEYYPFSKVKRFPFVAAGRAQKLCRHMLNVSSSFLSALDSHDTHSAPMLIPVAAELEDVIQQLKACMSALAGIVQQTVSVDRAVDMVINLEDLTQHLFLSVLSQGTSTDSRAGPDTILGVTFLAMLFNAAYVVRLLCVALVQAFSPDDMEALAHASMLSDSTRWAVDEQLMVLCSDMMAAALYPDSGEEEEDSEDPAPLQGDATTGWEGELASASRLMQEDPPMTKFAW